MASWEQRSYIPANWRQDKRIVDPLTLDVRLLANSIQSFASVSAVQRAIAIQTAHTCALRTRTYALITWWYVISGYSNPSNDSFSTWCVQVTSHSDRTQQRLIHREREKEPGIGQFQYTTYLYIKKNYTNFSCKNKYERCTKFADRSIYYSLGNLGRSSFSVFS